MNRALVVLLFLGCAALPPIGVWASLGRVPEPQVLQLEPTTPCPEVSPLRRRLATIPEEGEQLRVVDAAEQELWDIPDPVFGLPVPWPDDLPAKATPEGFSSWLDGNVPEGIDVELDCSEYPCLAILRSREPPEDPKQLRELRKAFLDANGPYPEAVASVWGVGRPPIDAALVLSVGEVSEEHLWRYQGRVSGAQNNLRNDGQQPWIADLPGGVP